MLASDGLGSIGCRRRPDDPPLDPLRAAARFSAFKTTRGAFLQRRARRALREMAERDLRPGDDLALAALIPAARKGCEVST